MTVSTAEWRGGLEFSVQQDGHVFTIDGSREFGGRDRGPGPKNLLLTALIGCSGMDVVSILRKMKIEDYSLRVTARGTLTEDHPRIFSSISVLFSFTGPNLPESKLRKAVELSRDRYCGVWAMLNHSSEISYSIETGDAR